MQEAPRIVNHTDSVRVSVRGNADVRPAVQNRVLKMFERSRIGRRQLSAEKGIMSVMNNRQFASRRMQNRGQRRFAYPE